MGPGFIANLEALPGLTDQWPNGYFKQGTTVGLSHLFQDLATWYEQSHPQYADRVRAMVQTGLSPAPGTSTQVQVWPMWRPGSSGTTPTATQGACRMWTARHRRRPALRRTLSHEDDHPRARRFRLAGQSVLLHIRSDGRPLQQEASGRVAIHYVPADDWNLQYRSARDGRPLFRYDTPCRTALPPRWHQLGPDHDPPAELSGSTTSPSLLPARRVPCLTPAARHASAVAQSDRKGRAEEVNLASGRQWPVSRDASSLAGERRASLAPITGRLTSPVAAQRRRPTRRPRVLLGHIRICRRVAS